MWIPLVMVSILLLAVLTTVGPLLKLLGIVGMAVESHPCSYLGTAYCAISVAAGLDSLLGNAGVHRQVTVHRQPPPTTRATIQ